MEQVAYLEFKGRQYFARGPATPTDSPLTRLIEGVYASEPAHAREILRARIFCTEEPSAFGLGMVKVAAKRWSRVGHAPDLAGATDLSQAANGVPTGALEIDPAAKLREPAALREWLAAREPRPDPLLPLHARDRVVVALLLDRDGRPLAAARNTNSTVRTRHAELNVIQNFVARAGELPRGFRLVASLKPCRMCAGLVWECAQPHRDFRVFYRDFDPGPMARETLLDPEYEQSLDQVCNPSG